MNIDYDEIRAKQQAALHHRHTGDCFDHKSQMVCVVAEIEDNAIELVLSLLDEIAELRALLRRWVPHLRRHGCDGLGLEYAEEVAQGAPVQQSIGIAEDDDD